MGWTSIHAEHYDHNGKVNRQAECRGYFLEGLNRGYFEILKDHMNGSTYYAAVKQIDTGTVFAAVMLTSVNNNDYFNFSYKDMDDTCGPCYRDCPDSILDLLTPTESLFAIQWRADCRTLNQEKREKKTPGRLPVGTWIQCTIGGKEYNLIKHPAAYQFKRPFWYHPASGHYVKSNVIPSNFKIIEK